MTIGPKIAGELLENFMKSYKFENGKLVLVNETLAKKACEQLSEMLDNTSREWWIQLESSEDSLAKMADEIDFEQKEGNPTKLSNKVAKSSDKKSEEKDGGEDEEVTESFDFNSIFEDGDVHIHNYGKDGGAKPAFGGEVDEESFAPPAGPLDNDQMGNISGGAPTASAATMTFANPSTEAGSMGITGNDPTGAINARNNGAGVADAVSADVDEAGDDYEFDLSFLEEPEAGEEHNAFGNEAEPEGEGKPEGEEEPDGDEDDIDDISFDEPKGKEKGTAIKFGKGKEEVEEDDEEMNGEDRMNNLGNDTDPLHNPEVNTGNSGSVG